MAEQKEPLARIYMAVNNPNRDFIPGVANRSITVDEWRDLPDHVRASVDGSKFFRKPKRKAKQGEVEGTEAETAGVGEGEVIAGFDPEIQPDGQVDLEVLEEDEDEEDEDDEPQGPQEPVKAAQEE